MAGIQLDGAGQAKMVTLEEGMKIYQRVHGLVENYALSVKNNKPAASFLNAIKRQMPTLASKLKGQFGMISDLAGTASDLIGTASHFVGMASGGGGTDSRATAGTLPRLALT